MGGSAESATGPALGKASQNEASQTCYPNRDHARVSQDEAVSEAKYLRVRAGGIGTSQSLQKEEGLVYQTEDLLPPWLTIQD